MASHSQTFEKQADIGQLRLRAFVPCSLTTTNGLSVDVSPSSATEMVHVAEVVTPSLGKGRPDWVCFHYG